MGDRVGRAPAVLLAVFIGMLTVLIGGSPAYAHNVLTGSNPTDGAELAEAPETVRLTFLAKLNPEQTGLTVAGPDGQPAFTGTPVVDGTAVSVAFQAGPAGEYTVDYDVLSADGHRVKGALAFTLTVGVEPTEEPTPSAQPSPSAISPTPQEATSAPSPASPEATASQETTPWWPWLLGGVVLLAAAGAGAFFVRRRSS